MLHVLEHEFSTISIRRQILLKSHDLTASCCYIVHLLFTIMDDEIKTNLFLMQRSKCTGIWNNVHYMYSP